MPTAKASKLSAANVMLHDVCAPHLSSRER
jgi:hypothetical protein